MTPERLHCEDLVAARVFTSDGDEVGRVVDIEVRPGEDWRVASLIVGRFALLDRFDLLRPVPYRLLGHGEEQVVDWADVERYEDRALWLREGARPKRPPDELEHE